MHARRLTLDARRSTPRSQSGVKGEGTHFRIPWLQTPHIFDVRIRPRNISSATGTKDLQVVTINLRVLSQPDKDMLPQIFQQYGKLTASWLGSGLGCWSGHAAPDLPALRSAPHTAAPLHLVCTAPLHRGRAHRLCLAPAHRAPPRPRPHPHCRTLTRTVAPAPGPSHPHQHRRPAHRAP